MIFDRLNPLTGEVASRAEAMQASDIGAIVARAAMPTGDPCAGATPLGAVVDQKTVRHVNGLIEDAVSKGARVVAVIRARDEADAIRIANDSEYGLSASVFTRDVARGLGVARQIRSGICHVNGPTVHDEAQMPFGGVGASGYGRFGGKAGIDAFTELRWITVETRPGHYPI